VEFYTPQARVNYITVAVRFSISGNWAASEPCRTFTHDVGPKRLLNTSRIMLKRT